MLPPSENERSASALVELRNGADVRLRPPVEGDFPYISACWLNAYRDASVMRHVGNEVYFTNEQRLIRRLWRDALWLVAVSVNDPAFILGYMCGEGSDAGPIVHWVYVRAAFRKLGLARAMVTTFSVGLPAGPYWHSRITNAGTACLRVNDAQSHLVPRDGWEYNPYLAGGLAHAPEAS